MTKAEVRPASESSQDGTGGKKFSTISSHGITLQINQQTVNDLEVLDLLDDILSGNVFRMPKLMRRIFGDQHEVVMDGLRNDEGIVSADTASEFLVEVLEQINPN